MTIQKTWTELLGKPQDNDMVWGNEIIREVALHRFTTLWTFDNNTQANICYNSWLKENENVDGLFQSFENSFIENNHE